MKTRHLLNALFLPFVLISLTILSLSFAKADDKPPTYRVSGDASGAQAVPTLPVLGTASLTGTYNTDNNTLTYTVIWNGLSDIATAAHFHGPALPGATANPIHDLNITSNGVNGMATGSIVITDSTEAHLLEGKIYYNLPTLLHTTGEIRGQVATTTN